jgi:hypothetical protein
MTGNRTQLQNWLGKKNVVTDNGILKKFLFNNRHFSYQKFIIPKAGLATSYPTKDLTSLSSLRKLVHRGF